MRVDHAKSAIQGQNGVEEVEEGQRKHLECRETNIHEIKGNDLIVTGWEEK